MIGKSVPRVDAYEKVTGRAKFTDDLILNKCLVARVYHAKIGNGVVKSIDTSEAEALDGVVKVVTFKDVPNHCYPTPGHPWSVELAHQDVADRNLLTGRVRYYGDDIAAVVAEDEVTASRALKLIKVEYEEYPVVVSPKISMRGTEHPIHLDKKDNILARSSFAIGDVDSAMEKAAVKLKEAIRHLLSSTAILRIIFLTPIWKREGSWWFLPHRFHILYAVLLARHLESPGGRYV